LIELQAILESTGYMMTQAQVLSTFVSKWALGNFQLSVKHSEFFYEKAKHVSPRVLCVGAQEGQLAVDPFFAPLGRTGECHPDCHRQRCFMQGSWPSCGGANPPHHLDAMHSALFGSSPGGHRENRLGKGCASGGEGERAVHLEPPQVSCHFPRALHLAASSPRLKALFHV
jgi:hypothetical protein